MFWLLFVIFEVYVFQLCLLHLKAVERYVFQLCNILLHHGSDFSMHMGGSPLCNWLTELVSFKFIHQYMYFLLGSSVDLNRINRQILVLYYH